MPLIGKNFEDRKRIIFKAAKNGDVRRLRTFLSEPNDETRKLVTAVTEGTTPVLVACRHGHLDVVSFLIKDCMADIEQPGSVTFDGETIDGAPPLWCSAAAGHFNIVQTLVNLGANVNKTTFTNSTPLRAACFDGHFEIVKYLVEHRADIEVANRHGHTCLMIACYKGHLNIVKYLLDLGANVNRQSVKGNTALHDCAESGSLEIMKLLLEYKAEMHVDHYGMTPTMAAAVAGHTSIVDYLATRVECPRQDCINAFELLGATFVDKKRDMLSAVTYWFKALDERKRKSPKVISKPESKGAKVLAYDNAVEFRTKEELTNILSDPDEMRMQALLVRERILGPAHPDTSYYIRYRGAVYADAGNFERCIMLWMYALDMQQQVLEPLNCMTQSSLLSFAELFAYMQCDHHADKIGAYLHFRDVMVVLVKGLSELERSLVGVRRGGGETMGAGAPPPAAAGESLSPKDAANFDRGILIMLHLIALVANMAAEPEQAEYMKRMVYKFVRLNPRNSRGYGPLHLAVDRDTSQVGRYPVCSFPTPRVVEVLLECGASANDVDLDKRTPLHVLASQHSATCNMDKILELLLSRGGAHPDACDAQAKTPADLTSFPTSSLHSLTHTTLQCLAARTIVRHSLPYQGHVQNKLEEFVSLHKGIEHT